MMACLPQTINLAHSSRVPNVRLSTPYTPELNLEDFEPFKEAITMFKSDELQSSAAEPLPHESSRVVAMAMKTLQTMIWTLETNNDALGQIEQELKVKYLPNKERLRALNIKLGK
mmetsp:Transcript_29208/g.52184  ORF Transcript_29208/g.52184 Transcript_29208/m.52184 type:complete len:115 (+) Transcript_29208:641-985(+)